MEDDGGIVVEQRHVVATHRCYVGTDWQAQKAVYLLRLLGLHGNSQ